MKILSNLVSQEALRRGILVFASIITTITVSSCFVMKQDISEYQREEGDKLTKSYASHRSKMLSGIHYGLNFDLTGKSSSFDGSAKIEFTLERRSREPLTIDFSGIVKTVYLNGESIKWDQRQGYISIESFKLKNGKNTIEISFSAEYSLSASGFIRYVDRATGKAYVYTNFEPDAAHQMFPHFDQPDLKASFETKIKAPSEWRIISATDPIEIARDSATKTVHFSASRPIPSYAFSIIGGEFLVTEKIANGVPLRVFYRPGLEKVINVEEWLQTTQQSLFFFERFLGSPYPFGKYDQILIPNLTPVAMENVAASTFREAFFSGEQSYLAKQRHSNVIAHELVHSWFGNLISVQWWDELWLNESLATYLATLQQGSDSEFKNSAWTVFDNEIVQRAYDKDMQPSTHPVSMDIESTEHVHNKFDGISYSKGAILLRQMHYVMGDAKFSAALSSFIQKYRGKNVVTKNLLDEFSSKLSFDVALWEKEWLKSRGINSITADFSCGIRGLDKLNIAQTTSPYDDINRSQKIDIGLFNNEGGKLILTETISTFYSGSDSPVRVPDHIGCPDFILLNKGNLAYVRASLDDKSLRFFLKNAELFSDELALRIWSDLWYMVLQGTMSIEEYKNAIVSSLPVIKSDYLTRLLLQKLVVVKSYYEKFLLPRQSKLTALNEIERVGHGVITSELRSMKFRSIALTQYINLVQSNEGLALLQESLRGEGLAKNMVIDQNSRWAMVLKLNQYAFGSYEELARAELRKNPGPFSERSFKISTLIQPNIDKKLNWLNSHISPRLGSGSQDDMFFLSAIFSSSQSEMGVKLFQNVIDLIEGMGELEDSQMLANIIRSSSLNICEKQSLAKLNGILGKIHDQLPIAYEQLNDSIYQSTLCISLLEKHMMESNTNI
ncbi:MAG: M1 family aminopeptidase [Pseudomonadota bacterium]